MLRAAEQRWLQTNAGMLKHLLQHTVHAAGAAQLDARALATVAYGAACGGRGVSSDMLFAALAMAAERVCDFNAQDLANTA